MDFGLRVCVETTAHFKSTVCTVNILLQTNQPQNTPESTCFKTMFVYCRYGNFRVFKVDFSRSLEFANFPFSLVAPLQ